MKATSTTILILVSFCWLQVTSSESMAQNGHISGNTTPDTTISRSGWYFRNAGFEEWTEGIADYWDEVIDVVGGTLNNVTVVPELFITTEGNYSARVQSKQPIGGISHSISGYVPEAWNVYPERARAAIHYGKANGTSAWFNEHSRVQEDFQIVRRPGIATAIRNAHVLRLDSGDLIELFSATTTSEYSYQGAVYMKRNGGDPELFFDFTDHRTWAWPGVVDMDTNYVFVSMRLGQDGQQHLYATDVTRDFTAISNDRLLYGIDSTNVQCYSMLKLGCGTVIMPIVYASVKHVESGPWYLDILTTSNFNKVLRLDDPKTYGGRGLMEAYPVLLTDETVAILCRTNQGHLAKVIYKPNDSTLSAPVATDVIQPQTGSFARNLNDNSILLSWTANIDMRKVLVVAVSDDDMATWQSYHIVMTSAAMGHSMSSLTPYIHQPFVFEDSDGSITCYYEEVINSSTINLFKSCASEYRINNVANELNTWQLLNVNMPAEASSVQLLNVIGKQGIAYFDQTIVTETPMLIRSDIALYPNPVENLLTIIADQPVTRVDIIDLNGKLINSEMGTNVLSMNDLPGGVYIVKVHQRLKVSVFKVIKV